MRIFNFLKKKKLFNYGNIRNYRKTKIIKFQLSRWKIWLLKINNLKSWILMLRIL